MNKFYKCLLASALVLGFVACDDDEENTTIVVQDEVETGAVLRTINDPSDNPALVLGGDVSGYLIQIEEQDELEGDLLESVDVFVRFNDLTILSDQSITGAGADLSNPADPMSDVLLRTIPASDFTDGPFGLPRTDIVITEADLAAVLPISDFSTSDQVIIRLALNLTDGRVFSVNNAGGIITAGFFNSPFQYLMNIDAGININYLEESNNFFVTLDGFDNTYFVLAELTDQSNGDNIETLNVYRRFEDNNGDDVDNSFPETLVATFSAGDFGTSPDGFPTASVTLTPEDLLGDLDAADVNIGDAFFVRYEIITVDGRTVTNEVVAGNFYDIVEATDCPFPPIGEDQLGDFVGDYLIEQVAPSIFGYETFNFDATTTLELFAEVTDGGQQTPGIALEANQRSFDADYLAALGFGNTDTYIIEFNICKVTITLNAGPVDGSTGLVCDQAGPPIILGPLDGGLYNAEDDNEFILAFVDDVNDNCGTGTADAQIRFTKQ